MTTKKRAKPEHLQKLTALFEQYPDGLNMRQIQTELQTSPHNAQAALDELGAVKQGAKWVLPDDEVVEPEQVAPGAKADIELSGNSGELPTTEKPQLVGDTDQLPKAFDQSVFVGLPSSAKWATVNIDGTGEAWAGVPDRLADGTWDAYGQCFSLGGGFDGSKWRDSIIQREPVASTDVEKQELENPVSEQKQDDAACPMPCIDQPYVYQNPIADDFYRESKSDYAKVLDVMLTKVLNAVKDNGGATIGRICELVDVYPDDVPDCVDILVDNGQLISRPLYFTTVYEVAA